MAGLGTEFKIKVHAEPLGEIHMEDYDFECEFFVYHNKSVVIPKSDMMQIDKDNYFALILSDMSRHLGRGQYRMIMTSHIPDTDFPDGLRTEVTKEIICQNVVVE